MIVLFRSKMPFILFSLFLLFSRAGFTQTLSLSEIEPLIKNTVIEAYEGSLTESDIWGLEFYENNTDFCEHVVFGYAKLNSKKQNSTYWFLVCLEKKSYSKTYSARLIYNDMVLSEKSWWWPF